MNTPFEPYFTLLVAQVINTLMGYYINNAAIIYNSLTCLLLAVHYNYTWYVYAPLLEKRKMQRYLFVASIIFMILLLLPWMFHRLTYAQVFSITSCMLGILLFASPLIVIFEVISKRTTQGLDYNLTLMSTLCSGLWFAYGCLLNNVYIYLPNGIGLIFSLIQIFLFLLYNNNSHRNRLNNYITTTTLVEERVDL